MCDTGKEEEECEVGTEDSGRGKNKTKNPVQPGNEGVAEFEYRENNFKLMKRYEHTIEHQFRVEKLSEKNETNFVKKTFEEGEELGNFVRYLIDDDRHVKATTNNPNSSRSHSLIFVKFKESEESDGPTLIVGDFAGVENEFDCENEKVKEDFMNIRSDRNINEYFYKKEVKGDILDPIGQLKTSNNNQNSSNDDEKQLYINPINQEGGSDDDIPSWARNGGADKIDDDELPLFDPESIEINFSINKDKWIKDGQYTILKNFTDAKTFSIFANIFINSENKEFKQLSDQEYVELHNSFKNYKFATDKIFALGTEEVINMDSGTLTGDNKTKESELFNNAFKAYIDYLKGATDNKIKLAEYDSLLLDSTIATKINQATTEDTYSKFKPFFNYYNEAINKLTGKYDKPQLKEKLITFGKELNIVPRKAIGSSNNETWNNLIGKQYNTQKVTRGKKIDTQALREKLIGPRPGGIESIESIIKSIRNTYNAIKESAHFLLKKLGINDNYDTYFFNIKEEGGFITDGDSNVRNKIIYEENKPFENLKEKLKLTETIDSTFMKNFVFGGGLKTFIDNMLASRKRRLEIGDTICKHRRTEGYFINDSLKDIRSAIRDMLYEKNKDALSIVPNYVDICFDKYCPNHENCFAFDKKITKVDKTSFTGSVIFDEIFNKLKPNSTGDISALNDLYKDLLVGVFCVVNVSKKASNPPPVPYIDINELKRIVYYNEAKDIINTNDIDTNDITKKFVKESLKLINTIDKKYIDTDPETQIKKNKVQDIIDAKLKQDIEAPIYDQFDFINKDNKQKAELISTNYNLFKMIVYHLLKKSGFEDPDQIGGDGENELPEYANKFINEHIKGNNEKKIKGLIELDLMRLNALYGWATTTKELKQKQYLGSQYQTNVGYGLMTLEGDKTYDSLKQRFGTMKKKITPSIDIYITHVHDEFIKKYIEVFELEKTGFNKENLINTLNINQGYHHMASVIKESIKAYIETNNETNNEKIKLLYPDSNAFIRIFLEPKDNENKSYVSTYDGKEEPRSPILRIVDAYVDIEHIFKKETVQQIRDDISKEKGSSYLKNFNNKIQNVQNKNEESKAIQVNNDKKKLDSLEYEEKEEEITVEQLEKELLDLIKQQDEKYYSDSIYPKTKDDFVRNLSDDAFFSNLEVYYKIKENYKDDDWKKKEQEIKDKRAKRAAKKNNPVDDGLDDGVLSTMYQRDNNNSTSQKDTFITNLPEFINEKAIEQNITEIIRNPPKVLQTIFNFLEIVDNSNAISTIGTIEFTDKLAKLNTVATVCNDEDEGTNLFNKLKETIKFEPLYKSPNTNTGGKTMKRNKGGKRKTMKMSKA